MAEAVIWGLALSGFMLALVVVELAVEFAMLVYEKLKKGGTRIEIRRSRKGPVHNPKAVRQGGRHYPPRVEPD